MAVDYTLLTDEVFKQSETFDDNVLSIIKTNISKSSKETRFKYSAIAHCEHTTWPVGYYDCSIHTEETKTFGKVIGIKLHYQQYKSKFSQVGPANNTNHATLFDALMFGCIAYVYNDGIMDYNKILIYPITIKKNENRF